MNDSTLSFINDILHVIYAIILIIIAIKISKSKDLFSNKDDKGED